MVPNGWKLTSLGDISSKVQTGPFGSQLHAHEYTDEGIPVLMPKDLINGRADINSAAKITESRADDLAKHRLKKGDILFSRRGDVARFGLITEESEGALCGTGCLKASISKEHSALFLSYFLQKNAVRKWLEQNAVGQTMLNLNTTILSELPIMVASSKQEQQKIAKILSTWDKAISATECLIDNSTQQKKALMQQLLTGKKRLLDESGKRFEDEWEEVKLQSVLDLMRSGLSRKLENENVGIAVIRSNNMGSKYTNNVDLKYWYLDDPQGANVSNYILDDGDLLVNFINSLSQIGKACIYRKNLDVDAIYTTNILRIKPNTDKVDPIYLYLLTQTANYDSYITSITKPAVNQASFTTKEFGNLKFNLPSLKEQQKISTVLTNADREIELLEQQLADLQQEKKALMQVLLTGKKRVVV